MSGFQVWIPKEHLPYFHRVYSNPSCIDLLNMRKRIEQKISAIEGESECRKTISSQLQRENSAHSTTEVHNQFEEEPEGEEDTDMDIGIMDRADVLFKYILRSFRKYYCKSFNDVTEYRKRKRRVTLKLTLINAMKEFKDKMFPDSNLPDLEIYLLSLITHRVSPRIPKRNKWLKIKDLMKTTLYQFNRKRLQTFLSHPQFAFLLLKFLETPEILSTLSKRSQLIKDEKWRTTLLEHIDLLKNECISRMESKFKDSQA